MVRASRLHREDRGFESFTAHKMKIRHANLKDAPMLSKLMGLIINSTHYYSIEARKEETKKHDLKFLKQYLSDKKYYCCLVATEEKEIIGFAIGRNEAGVFWADWLGVRKDKRRGGVAELLMKEWEKILKKKGVHKIWCDTRTSNKESVSLLLKLKYKKLGLFGNGWYKQDFFLWEKNLI